MSEGHNPIDISDKRRRLWPERRRMRLLSGIVLMLLGFLGYAWVTREQIARDIISDEFERMGIPASYAIRSIGPEEQVLTNLVLGDPASPDFTAESVTVKLIYGLGTPEIGQLTLINPRLYGTYHDGVLSIGSLDEALFGPSDEPPGLPSFDLRLIDGRGLIESDFGAIGIKADGEGNLASGFDGMLAISAPELTNGTCSLSKFTAFGRVETAAGLPSFNGPLRLRDLSCPDEGLAVGLIDWQLEASGAADFGGFEARGAFESGTLTAGAIAASNFDGFTQLRWNEGGLSSRFDAKAQSVSSDAVQLGALEVGGGLRAQNDFSSLSADLDLRGDDVAFPALAAPQLAGSDIPVLAPLLAKLDRGLRRVERGNSFQADVSLRQTDSATTVAVPQALLKDASGETLASLSRVQVRFSDQTELPLIEGNAILSGQDLPQLQARMEGAEGGIRVMRVRIDPFSAQGSALAIPELSLRQSVDGSLRFSGGALATGGSVETGFVQGLSIPIQGTWNEAGGLAVLSRCQTVRARRVNYAALALDRPALEVCPQGQSAGLIYRNGALTFGLTSKSASLSGRLAEEPLAITAGSIAYDSRTGLLAKNLSLELGSDKDATLARLATLTGDLSDTAGGKVSGIEFALAAVPLDFVDGTGTWSYSNGGLSLVDGALTVLDREKDPRFEPLISRDAKLTYTGGVIVADGTLLEPFSLRQVMRVDLQHELESGVGEARLAVEDLLFDEALQPAAGSDVCLNRDSITPDFRPVTPGLSCLALGIVANVRGSVNGQGLIQWDPQDITSSGAFTTQDADLAAAFGPLEGVSGTVEFTDLLDLTTAPTQTFTIRAINPGIEVLNGEVAFNLREGQVLEIESGSWPFMGGELALAPSVLDFREPMDRRYVLVIDGLDAAKFVQQMELGNLSATGIFDGSVPIIFDTDGNGRIEGGLLQSRPPGGNVSYIGELTYEDLGAMANFAFQSLRSLDFSEMEVEMEGALTGEIITRLKFDGVQQGEGASSNFVTRQIAKLPIQFRVNIRADFYSLLTNLQSMYDPAFVRDPRELGLLESDGARFTVPRAPQMPAIKPEDLEIDEPAIQREESETMP